TWYGNGKFDDNDTWWLECKAGQYNGNLTPTFHSVTGLYIKKINHYRNTSVNSSTYSTINYAWPMLRLADLYLMYAEAMNEAYGPGEEVFNYLNQIRAKAGIPTVQEAWDNHSRTPGKYSNREGLREIIQQERTIELAFEGHRFWDLRRWKTAPLHLNRPILGWSITNRDAETYYRPNIVFSRKFEFKDYFWPIRERDLIVNSKLVQNPGW
ncbi:MAG TPA: RagB/SusD family nutrient uptake outer membrane protein, partial [Sphingobacterium sp.]|nr:RagB/SusD family nutrient uptake outer membrane protein [Sphingobacterium sp.]